MEHQPSRVDSPPPSRQRLADLVVFEYRSLVMRRLDVTAEWRGLEWTGGRGMHLPRTGPPTVRRAHAAQSPVNASRPPSPPTTSPVGAAA